MAHPAPHVPVPARPAPDRPGPGGDAAPDASPRDPGPEAIDRLTELWQENADRAMLAWRTWIAPWTP